MCNFRVGQKVVCVGDGVSDPPAGHVLLTQVISPVKGSIYTVRRVCIGAVKGEACLQLEEIPDQEASVLALGEIWVVDIAFDAVDFRPLVERNTDISVFTALLSSSKVEEPA